MSMDYEHRPNSRISQNEGMERITVRVPESQFSEIEDAVKDHGYPNRSEFVREAVRDKLSENAGDAR